MMGHILYSIYSINGPILRAMTAAAVLDRDGVGLTLRPEVHVSTFRGYNYGAGHDDRRS